MKRKKVMATSLTALTLLSAGAITTYVANNVLVQAESDSTNKNIEWTVWRIKGVDPFKTAKGDFTADKSIEKDFNVEYVETKIEGTYKVHYYKNKNETTPTTSTTTTSTTSSSNTAGTKIYLTKWLLVGGEPLARSESGDLGSKKELEKDYTLVESKVEGNYRVHYYKKKSGTTDSSSTTTSSSTNYVWSIKDGKKYLTYNGKPVTGLQTVDGKKYYFGIDGAAKVGVYVEGDKRFYFDKDGVLQKGWFKIGDKYYYFQEDGTKINGIQSIGDKKYYFEDGIQVVGLKKVDNKLYFVTEDEKNITR